MARSVRIEYKGARYHVINRGNYRKDLFSVYKTADAFTDTLFEACERFDWWLHAFVIMDNHFHLCLETPKANLIDGMHWLQSCFANRFSAFSGERGHVFQGRYKSLLIEGDFGLLNVVDYIHLNPVRSGLVPVQQLRRYSHGSFAKFFSERRHPRLRCEDFLNDAGGLKPGIAGMRSYHKRLKLIMAQNSMEREQLFKDLTKGWYIGSREGQVRMAKMVQDGEVRATRDARSQIVDGDFDRLMTRGLVVLKKTSTDIHDDKKSAQWKVALANWIKERSPAKNRQISEALNMGHPATMSNHLTTFRRERQSKCPNSKKLSQML